MDNKHEKKQNPGKSTWRKGLIILIIIVAVAAAITTTLISIKMFGLNKILKSQSGYYILHLELAYTVSQVQDVINSWQGNPQAFHIALESIRWDWFLILSYVIFLTAFYYLFSWKFKEAFKRTWTVFLFFPLAAGIFDVIENIFMQSWLKSSETPDGFVVFLGSLSATVKFLLIILTFLAIINSWLIRRGDKSTTIEEVLAEEFKLIKKKRNSVDSNNTGIPGDLFGIALSGGGIRSATLNAGILDIFNKVGIFSKADYLSTVSGGGFIGGYVQAKLWREQMCNNPYETLFDDNDINHLEKNGEYLTPGKNTITKFFSYLRLGGAFVFSMIMNFTWFLSLLLALFILVQMIFGPLFKIELAAKILWGTTALVFSYHFFGHSLRILKVGKYIWSSKVLNIIEGVLLLPIIVYFISTSFPGFNEHVVPAVNKFLCVDVKIPIAGLIEKVPLIPVFLITLLILFISAIFYSPNVLSLHRFFKEQLSMTYLETNPEGKKYRYLKLADLNSNMTGAKGKREWKAPYPLINTCLNLLGEGGNGKKGLNFRAKLSDYFLLSPLFCGSYRTGYVKTDSPVYRYMTLSTAISISGAAINPNMGVRTNRFVAFFMALLNLKSGYWALNPRKARRHFYYTVWPYYLLRELFSSTNTNRWKINLSDGGHIENLAVYELLRRKCRLIIAVDAGADPGFDFSDLKNLVIRARNELGIVIKFRAGQDPESIIKPKPSIGYSDHHFAIADVEKLPTRTNQVSKKIGVLIYLKSSLKAPLTNKTQVKSRSKSYDYKTNHPDFPHESTADQFFDEAQWEAYYDLGKRMAGDLLKIDNIEVESLIAKTKLQLEKTDVNGLIKYLV